MIKVVHLGTNLSTEIDPTSGNILEQASIAIFNMAHKGIFLLENYPQEIALEGINLADSMEICLRVYRIGIKTGLIREMETV
jgi:hypothetical protein